MTRTTLEMDGIYTEKDAEDRFFVMKPCVDCAQYSRQDTRIDDKPCHYCGGTLGTNGRYWFSVRTYNISKKLSAADKKKLGS